MWRLVTLLTCLTSTEALSRNRYTRLPGVLTGRPHHTVQAGSQLSCASHCSKQHYFYCTGYSYTSNGTCHMFPTPCWETEPREAQPGVVSCTRPLAHVHSCNQGGLALNNTCYYHRYSVIPLTWEAAKITCGELGACARLAQPKDRLTYEFLLNNWRPNDEEWIGVADEDGDGVVTNMDGSQPSWQPSLVSHASAGPVFLPQGLTREIHRSTPVHNAVHRYVCETRHDCRLRQPCPEGWLLIHGICYSLITEPLPWLEADVNCGRLGRYGHLADAGKDIWAVLWEFFFQSNGGSAYIGVRDMEIEGLWNTVYNRTVNINWMAGQPDDAGGNEDCLEMVGDLAIDIPCSTPHPYVCRTNANTC